MSAFKRLDQVLKSSREIPFSNKSKIVFMSDCHRGDGSRADDFAPNKQLYLHALRQYYNSGYTYIEIGDGDELWENSRFDHIVRAHEDVFKLLSKFHQADRFYMIWGNHDIVKSRKRIVERYLGRYYDESKRTWTPLLKGLSAYEGIVLKHIPTEIRLLVTHGHQADFINDRLWMVSCLLVRYVWRFLEILGIQDPISPAKNHNKQNKIERTLAQWAGNRNLILIAGHTHRPSFPQSAGAPYLNDGSCVFRDCITALEIRNGLVALVKWFGKTRRSGSTYYVREVIGGPKPLALLLTDAKRHPQVTDKTQPTCVSQTG